ncbi:alkaline phosphatase family protein [Chitinolyticbacter meiyuanensis]|uniref:alkaline phosphatase family protein n=1 Tax=Chitinolyticbacter meiyuanensis TaxID=682798 RepID=UPI0011E5FE31|nr:alkaline phosphatase family protein [Chitinolyticbacter meiyuanensis]
MHLSSLNLPTAYWPDYAGNSLLNLMSTLSRELTGPALGHAPLSHPLLDGIGRRRHVAMILIDGLGEAQLDRLGAGGWLHAAPRTVIDSVFPPTTAAAVTTILTGRSPAEHGLIGWHQLHGEEIIAPLPLYVRHPAASPSMPEALAASLYAAPPLFDRLDRSATLLMPDFICDSPCSGHHGGQAARLPYRDFDDAFAQLTARLAQAEPTFQYLYLPQLDTLMHERGPTSVEAAALFAELEAHLVRLAEHASRHDAAIVITADHGFVHAPAEQWIDIDRIAPLAELLIRPLSGETRLAYCHLQPGSIERFMALAQAHVGHACWPVESCRLLEAGVFGPGSPHPELARRCGDVTLIAKPGWNLRDTLPGERRLQLAGVHAGVTAEEIRIPLIVLRPR